MEGEAYSINTSLWSNISDVFGKSPGRHFVFTEKYLGFDVSLF